MLKKIDNHTVSDSSGYTVSVRDIHYVDYSESGRTCTVEIEGGVGKEGGTDWIIYSSTLTGWQNSDGKPMTAAKKKEVLQRISTCLDLIGMLHNIE